MDGPLPGVEDHIIVNSVQNPSEVFDKESASFEPHPASQLLDSTGSTSSASASSPHLFLESTGVFDCDESDIPARSLTSSAFINLIPKKTKVLTCEGGETSPLHESKRNSPGYIEKLRRGNRPNPLKNSTEDIQTQS